MEVKVVVEFVEVEDVEVRAVVAYCHQSPRVSSLHHPETSVWSYLPFTTICF